MHEIKIDKIIRSKRRTLSLEISKKGELIVRAPRRASDAEIIRIVNKKKAWIVKTQAKNKEKNKQVRKKEFKTGERFLYLGKNYKLIVIDKLDVPFFS